MTLRRRTPHRRAARQCTVADLHADPRLHRHQDVERSSAAWSRRHARACVSPAIADSSR